MQEKVLARVRSILEHTVKVFKDKEYQKKTWFRHEGPEVSSFIDDIDYFIGECRKLFKMSNYYEELGRKNGDKLKHLYNMIYQFLGEIEMDIDFSENDFKEEQLLSDPRWEKIIEASTDVYQVLSEYVGEDVL